MITSFVLVILMCDSGVECGQKLDVERLKCRTLSYNDVLNRTMKEYCSLGVLVIKVLMVKGIIL